MKGFTIPAGVHVDVPVYALHHDEDYWEDPWKFIPERCYLKMQLQIVNAKQNALVIGNLLYRNVIKLKSRLFCSS